MSSFAYFSWLGAQDYTAAELRTVYTTNFHECILVNVTGIGIFQYDPTSTAPDNGSTVIRPDVGPASTGPGRWIRPLPQPNVPGAGSPGAHLLALSDHVHPSSGGGYLTYADAAALRLVDTTGFPEGATADVLTVGLFQWDPNSNIPDDGVTSIKPAIVIGLGRWVRPWPAIQEPGDGDPGTRFFSLVDHVHPESGGILSYVNAAALRLVDTTTYLESVAVDVIPIGLFQWDPLSVVADDGITSIKPAIVVGAGRWIRPVPAIQITGAGSPGTRYFSLADHVHPDPGAYVVPNLTQLALIDDSVLDDGITFKVFTLLDDFTLVKGCTLVTDGITVVNALSGVAKWVRDETVSDFWRQQTIWHINEITGNDEDDGLTAPTALASHAELERRLGDSNDPSVTRTIFLDSDITSEIYINFSNARYIGTQTLAAFSTLTAGTTACNPATSTRGVIEDIALPGLGFTGFVGNVLVLTGGANIGAFGIITKVNPLNNKQAYFTPFYKPSDGSNINPANGDTYTIYSLTEIKPAVDVTGTVITSYGEHCNTYFENVNIVATDLVAIEIRGGFAEFYSCYISPDGGATGCKIQVSDGATLELNSCFVQQLNSNDVYPGNYLVLNCSTIQATQIYSGAHCDIDMPCELLGDSNIQFISDGITTINTNSWLASHSHTLVNTGGVIKVTSGGQIICNGPIWGGGNTGIDYGFNVESGGQLIYNGAACKPHIDTAVTADCRIGIITKSYADIPFTNVIDLCDIVDKTTIGGNINVYGELRELGPGGTTPINIEAIAGARTLISGTDSQIQVLTATGAQDVILPADTLTGLYYWIESHGDALTVKRAGGATVVTLANDYGCLVKCTGATWVYCDKTVITFGAADLVKAIDISYTDSAPAIGATNVQAVIDLLKNQASIPAASSQATWYISSAGSDTAAGTVGAPLATFAEWNRRMKGRTISIAMTINVVNNLTEDVVLSDFKISETGMLRILGAASSLQTGTFTAKTDQAPATNVTASITDTALANQFTALGLVGKRIRTTSGASSGAISWIQKDLNPAFPKTARTSSWSIATYANPMPYSYSTVNVVVTDAYIIEELPTIGSFNIYNVYASDQNLGAASQIRIVLSGLKINANDTGKNILNSVGMSICLLGCHIYYPSTSSGTLYLMDCRITNLNPIGGTVNISSSSIIDGTVTLNPPARLIMKDTNLFEATSVSLNALSSTDIDNVGIVSGAANGLTMQANSLVVLSANYLWGSLNVGYGVYLYPGATFYGTLTNVKITGVTNDFYVGGVAKTLATLPYINFGNLTKVISSAGSTTPMVERYRTYSLVSGYLETDIAVSPGLVVGARVFDPSIMASVDGLTRTITFEAMIAATPGMTTSLELYNASDASLEATLTSTSAVPEYKSTTLTAPGNIPNSSQTYYARLYISAGAAGDTDRALVYNCALVLSLS